MAYYYENKKRNEFYVTHNYCGVNIQIKYKEKRKPAHIVTFAELAKKNAEKNAWQKTHIVV